MRFSTLSTFVLLTITLLGFQLPQLAAQSEVKDYKNYDFVPGEKILLDDNLLNDVQSNTPLQWNLEGGKATIDVLDNEKYILIQEYYTKLSPKLKNTPQLPAYFTIEYDTWLDMGYDGNPGIEIHLVNGEQEVLITPNKHTLSVSYPNHEPVAKENPEAYFGENKFYNRWVHISIAFGGKNCQVYLDQYKMIDISDCTLIPHKILVTGNTSQDLRIGLKNFKLATGVPSKKIELINGKFITHAIKFDINKAIIKPESMGVINQMVAYLTANPGIRFEIGGHTDSDGNDAANLKLSEDRAAAVKKLLVSLGISEAQLVTKGYGETKPIDNNTTLEGKANNRRVEFTKL